VSDQLKIENGKLKIMVSIFEFQEKFVIPSGVKRSRGILAPISLQS